MDLVLDVWQVLPPQDNTRLCRRSVERQCSLIRHSSPRNLKVRRSVMKLTYRAFSTCLLGCVLTLGAMSLLRAAPQAGAALPEEPTHSSIRVSDDERLSSMVKLAKLSKAQAQGAAIERSPV